MFFNKVKEQYISSDILFFIIDSLLLCSLPIPLQISAFILLSERIANHIQTAGVAGQLKVALLQTAKARPLCPTMPCCRGEKSNKEDEKLLEQ